MPLACLISASQKPRTTPNSIPKQPSLSLEGRKRYFIVHGGLFSRDDVTFDEIRAIPRMEKKQPGQEGLMMEALWTDPQDGMGRGPSKRGVGLGFGPDVTQNFCNRLHVTAVIRSHEVRDEGFSIEHDGRCITVFSAPNCERILRLGSTPVTLMVRSIDIDSVGNKAAFIRIDDAGELKFTQYDAQPVRLSCSRSRRVSYWPAQHPAIKPMAYSMSPLGMGGFM